MSTQKPSCINNPQFQKEWQDFQADLAHAMKVNFDEAVPWGKEKAIEILSKYSDTEDLIKKYQEI